jgi:TetR/AcrR family transcriptional repressor of mexJK operon
MASWVARMVETGRLEIADPEFAAEQLFTLMQSRLCMKRRLRLISTVSPEEIDQVVASAVRLFLRGYAPAH